MEELIKRITEKTGISEDQARTAVTTVSGFLKEKLPAPIAGQVDNVLSGAGGMSDDFPLASMYAHLRTLRLADGPDEVHKMTIARRELRRHDPDFRLDTVITRD